MYALVTTRHFDRSIAKFSRAHPELRRQLAKVLGDLESDPFQPHLGISLNSAIHFGGIPVTHFGAFRPGGHRSEATLGFLY